MPNIRRLSVVDGFTKEHNLKRLVYYEQFDTALTAIAYEKRIKKWRREWKITLIEERNREWNDLYDFILG